MAVPVIPKVLFVCTKNSARSQMAAAIFNRRCAPELQAESAGLEAATLNPLAVEAMRECGLDISKNETRSVFEVFKSGALFAYVVTVCDEASAEVCPIFPGIVERLHWSFEDPASFSGTWEERLAKTRAVRDQIDRKIEEWCVRLCDRRDEGMASTAAG